jgi:hypothetical protein
MSGFVLAVCAWFLVFGAIGLLIGQRKGRPAAGLLFAFLLGPIGWAVVALGPNRQQLVSTPCPHCAGLLPRDQPVCGHCALPVLWLRGRAFKPSRAA